MPIFGAKIQIVVKILKIFPDFNVDFWCKIQIIVKILKNFPNFNIDFRRKNSNVAKWDFFWELSKHCGSRYVLRISKRYHARYVSFEFPNFQAFVMSNFF